MGNVWEYVSVFYDPNDYTVSPYDDPLNTTTGDPRTLRGGSFTNVWQYLRTSERFNYGTAMATSVSAALPTLTRAAFKALRLIATRPENLAFVAIWSAIGWVLLRKAP